MNNDKQVWSRRNFLLTITSAGGAVMLAPLASWSYAGFDPKVDEIAKSNIGIDTHNHIDVPLDTDELPGSKLDLSLVYGHIYLRLRWHTHKTFVLWWMLLALTMSALALIPS